MSRTQEQADADDALSAAIEKTLSAYGFLQIGEMTREYVVLVATQKFEDDEVVNSYSTLVRDGSVSTAHAVGLMELAKRDMLHERGED